MCLPEWELWGCHSAGTLGPRCVGNSVTCCCHQRCGASGCWCQPLGEGNGGVGGEGRGLPISLPADRASVSFFHTCVVARSFLLCFLGGTLRRRAAGVQGYIAPPRQRLNIINNVLKPLAKITYCFPIAPFSKTDIATLDNLLIKITRHNMQLSNNLSNITILSPTTRGGIGLISLLADYQLMPHKPSHKPSMIQGTWAN